MEFVGKRLLFVAINFIDCQKQRLAAANQQTGEIDVRRCEFATSVDDQNDGVCLLQRDLGLAKDFCRNKIFFFRLDSAGVHDAQAMSTEVSFTIKAVASNSTLVA